MTMASRFREIGTDHKIPLLQSQFPMSSSLSAAGWADLPPELLKLIAGHLQNPMDLVRFHLVCRWWRISTPHLANKLSPFFPLVLSLSISLSCFRSTETLTIDSSAIAAAVYLLRPNSGPSKPWIVSVQESVAGKLVLRHALTNEEIASDLDLDFWISATRMTRSYSRIKFCENCNGIAETEKVEFVSNFSSRSGCSQLVGLGKSDAFSSHLFTFRYGLMDDNSPIASQFVVRGDDCFEIEIQDFVYFNGLIYVVDEAGHIYVFDHIDLKLIKLNNMNLHYFTWKRFVVSDGHLYVVLRYYGNGDESPKCRIYKLTMNEWEQVDDIGDRVLFITRSCSFSVNAQDLAPPWKGNCVVLSDVPFSSCVCLNQEAQSPEFEVFLLGESGDDQELPQFRLISSLQEGYSDLFAPPSTWRIHGVES